MTVLALEGIDAGYGETSILHGVSMHVEPGEVVAIIGPNGAGKTTLLKLLLGEIEPTAGSLRHGTKLEVIYFDQLREQIDEEKTVVENVGEGQENLQINGRSKHIYGYLQDFNPTLRAEFHRRLPAEALATLGGTTDSEYLFALIRHHLHTGDGRAAIRAAWAALAQMTSGHRALLNVVLYDRQRLIACRHALHGECPSLYYRLGVNGAAEAALVASARLDDDPAWREVAAHHLLVLARDGSVTQEAL